jgi:hypothetical protein
MGNRREKTRLQRLARKLGSLASDEEGQAVLEYILILSAAVVGAGLISRTILNTVDTGILLLGGQLEKDLKTGRLPLDIWKN